jgi:thymidylate synthase (FAD)
MARVTVPGEDNVLDKEIPCLDHGFVRLVDYMGSDESIVQAARVSYGKGTKKVRQDRGLIRYLLRHQHTSPFEMVEFKFHCKMPIFVARQWIRHRTASVNEYSLRYSRAIDCFYIPAPEQIRLQSKTNRQGRSEENVPAELQQKVLAILKDHAEKSWADYEEFEKMDVARELARMHLPLSLYTEWYWKIDLSNLLHFLKLRLDIHAQYEIRIYAEAIAGIVRQIVPMTWEAFDDYVLSAQTFSHQEMELLAGVLGQLQQKPDWNDLAAKAGFDRFEIDEFINKIMILHQKT